ncbi:hypothetical protein QCD79_31120, partial [Pseudomonas quasicaspiana]|nr:hypothetical protein [Pseudomonas quasicaspiana]
SRSKRVTCRSQLVGETSDPHRQKFRFANKLAPTRSVFKSIIEVMFDVQVSLTPRCRAANG